MEVAMIRSRLITTARQAAASSISTVALWLGSALVVHADAPPSGAAPPNVTVIAPAPPTEQQLAAGGLYEFVVHHATVRTPQGTGAISKGLLRWRGGRSESICPLTVGLDQAYNDFVNARVRAVAAYVGAPVSEDAQCKPNIQVLFTTDPHVAMQAILKWGAQSLGVGFPHQMQRELDQSAPHAIQGWYITAAGGGGVLNRDPGLVGSLDLRSLWPAYIPTSLHSSDGGRGMFSVILVIDVHKVVGTTIGSIADYVAMASLSVAQNPDHCDPLPSILDLMSSSCARDKPTGITAADLAFLKALYYLNTGLGLTMSQDDMVTFMTKALKSG
jgi:hypothetical protein